MGCKNGNGINKIIENHEAIVGKDIKDPMERY